MTPTLFILQIAILFLPGVIWAHLDSKFASRRDDGQLWFLMRALMFGIISHAAAWFIFWVFHQEYLIPNLVAADKEAVITDRIGWQIVAATGLGLVLSVLWMYLVNYKILTRFLQTIKATKTYGDEDVWDFLFNSNDAAAEYVHVRDFDLQLVYAGYVSTFSESGKLRELVLRDVVAYNLEGEEVYKTPRIYLARKPEGIQIEFPYVGLEQKE